MTLNIVLKADAPDPPYEGELVCHTAESTPFVLYGIWLKSQKYFWNSPSDWQVARTLLAEEGASLLMPCGRDIVNAIDRIYVQLDGRLSGLIRGVSGTGTDADPFVYSPAIPQDGGDPIAQPGSVIGSLHYHSEAWENLLDGRTSDNFDDDRSFRDQLDAIKAVLESTELDGDEIEGILNLILLALA